MGSSSSKSKEQEERERQLKEQQTRLEEERAREQLRLREQYERQQQAGQIEWLKEMLRQQELRRESEARLKQQQRMVQLRRESELRQQRAYINSLKKHRVSKNLSLINCLRQSFGLHQLVEFPITTYTETDLLDFSFEYHQIHGVFKKKNKRFFEVTRIVKVDNPFLCLHYYVAMKKFRENEYEDISERIMFHGTKCEFLDSICSLNFDRSEVKTHKFGWGVSFATNSFYATHYHHDNMRRRQKVMILTKVFYGDVDIGNSETIVPTEPSYTTRNPDGSVYVKYDDASFYPVYIIHYEGIHPQRRRQC